MSINGIEVCGFCARTTEEAGELIEGPMASICESCTEIVRYAALSRHSPAEGGYISPPEIATTSTAKTDATREGDSLISWLPKGEATYSRQDNGKWNVTLWERGTTNILEVLAHDMDKGVAAFMAIKVNEAIKSRTPGRMSGYINIPPQDTST